MPNNSDSQEAHPRRFRGIAVGRFLSTAPRRRGAVLRDDCEVSCGAIEELMNIVRPSNGVLGARMIGGGFGGCILVLVRSGAVDPMLAKVHREYDPRHESPSRAFVVQPSDGARCLRL
ncbi:MAG: hypothetical protein V1790_06080 [Planctomycetota bacterium]